DDVVRCGERVALISKQHDGVDLPTLLRYLQDNGGTLSALWEIGLQLVAAVLSLHLSPPGRSRPHGAIAPHNLMVTWDGHLRIFGLGLARLHDRALRRRRLPAEISTFLAPERFRGSP